MEPWSARDDAPYAPPHDAPEAAFPWGLASAAVIVVALGVAGWLLWTQERAPAALPAEAPRIEPAPAQAEAPAAEPAIRHPVERAADPALPTLDNSDTMMRKGLSDLVGKEPFRDMVYPAQLVRRIVATVDNLPRKTAPRRVMPLQPVPGPFAAAQGDGTLTIGPPNAARYAPYVRVFETIDTGALVRAYAQAYPLFQKAYEELGFPGRYFNDRLVEAIDDMLAAPEPAGPVALVRPKVLYQFADPDLESRSAGQKVLLRMGLANAARVKAKLREIRAELIRGQGNNSGRR